MEQVAIVYGMGELGGVFARGLLRRGMTVVPVIRRSEPDEVARRHPHPELVVVTVGENDLDPVLATMPATWRSDLVLVQNELLPYGWERHGLADPTVAVVWFEKKPGRPVTQIVPTPVFGPRASLICEALRVIGIDTELLDGPSEALLALITKNLYILTANIAGLETGGSVGELWTNHRSLATDVAGEVLDIQERLVGAPVDRAAAIAGMIEAIEADPEHGATGRSAPVRLRRALGHAAEFALDTPELSRIAESIDDGR